YPEGYTVAQTEPAPDDSRDGLVWYGQRSFGAGEPRVVLDQQAFSLLPVAAGLVIIIVIAFAGFAVYRRHIRSSRNTADETPALVPMTDTELMSLEDRIVQLLRSHDGELFQSDIVRMVGLPKSTVSTVLNDLHGRNRIIKVKKGRENLIRLSPDLPPDAEH
ncbi:MAG: transcriptional regulator, partial [Methanomicrobiales archaeon HGW-Methanomicrobiales-5]